MATFPEVPPVVELIPHRGCMILIDRVLEHDGRSTTVSVSIAGQRWLRREDGSVPAWLAVEFMAQCVAAHEGLLAWAEGRPLPLGFLVAARRLRIERSGFGADEVLRVDARRASGRPGLGALSHACSIHADGPEGEGALLATGRLSVALPRDSTGALASGLRS